LFIFVFRTPQNKCIPILQWKRSMKLDMIL
jgi:hypothetical protein